MAGDPGTAEFAGALADYAAGVADVLTGGAIVIAVPMLLLALLAAALVGGGVVLVVLAIVVPAVAVGLARELPPRVRRRLE
jgi:ABC-type dipeptide/oligopeptide/nickel transport system permease subunit